MFLDRPKSLEETFFWNLEPTSQIRVVIRADNEGLMIVLNRFVIIRLKNLSSMVSWQLNILRFRFYLLSNDFRFVNFFCFFSSFIVNLKPSLFNEKSHWMKFKLFVPIFLCYNLYLYLGHCAFSLKILFDRSSFQFLRFSLLTSKSRFFKESHLISSDTQ